MQEIRRATLNDTKLVSNMVFNLLTGNYMSYLNH